ncbi:MULTISPECIES: 16S rRNA (uracil(1498)-N(3))-methyltransferase [Gammaproteobacteria]|uniref:16S rRNA (uracil(1498)-N(3))-methyltransferase n=1 Tax=Gammaproteobacteria TaxID=1236 RepID=UPI000DD0933A|nr:MULTISPECIES: 16S rRNA (uracil(1498)-N(3))-methyltransferase [Gammaproteobacteria]RTE85610.1 16S rRNA (uracil(1498)-N(3))-methyltransferase [Aliidiomarina sp. B3213]TCZ89579.1 16S rRNA (uracil(1498)-N(3))-methyltransferase [Lysobacter sp. N42]
MRVPRIYHSAPLQVGQNIALDPDAANHVGRVLRLTDGAKVELFCGDHCSYFGTITSASKKHVQVAIESKQPTETESPIRIHLAQGISRGDRMDFALQKSVELGVHTITPIFTERCTVKLQGERLEKKLQQWQKIVVSACEQSGRNFVPQVNPAITLEQWLQQNSEQRVLVLDPTAKHSIAQLDKSDAFGLVIGPEGGLSEQEIEHCITQGAKGVLLGPRILRTETAALAALTALQLKFGDLQ